MQAAWMLGPFVGKPINPLKHMPLPWDQEHNETIARNERISRDEAKKRFEKLMARKNGRQDISN